MFGWLRNLFSKAKGAATLRVRGRYDAAQTNATNANHWNSADNLSARSANTLAVRKRLRERARYEVANNSFANGIVKTLANDCIGTGPRLQVLTGDTSANLKLQNEWWKWSQAVGLPRKLRAMRMARAVDGESFLQFVTNPALTSPVQLDIVVIEADQVSTPGLSTETATEIDGIKFDANGNPESYAVLKQHPGDGSSSEFTVVPAAEMVHDFRMDRPGQVRGIPEITPALPLMAYMRRYTLAVIQAAETAAEMAVVLQSQASGDDGSDEIEPFAELDMVRGTMLTLPAGYTAEGFKAEQPTSTYPQVIDCLIREFSRCINMPFNIAAGDSSRYNYASGRMDHQTYFKSIRVDQDDIEDRILDRIFLAWLDEAVLIPDFIPNLGPIATWDHQWFWDGTEHVDPVKEATAQQTRLEMHTTTLAKEYARAGLDWEAELRQRGKEIKLMQQLGLLVDLRPEAFGDPSKTGQQPGQPSQQQPVSTEDEDSDE